MKLAFKDDFWKTGLTHPLDVTVPLKILELNLGGNFLLDFKALEEFTIRYSIKVNDSDDLAETISSKNFELTLIIHL